MVTFYETLEPGAATAVEKRWWVLHTKPKAEKSVAAMLEKKRIQHFLPLVTVRHTYSNWQATFHKPLFPGYVFLMGNEDARVSALETNKLVSVLNVTDQELFAQEIGDIQRAVASGQRMNIFPALRAGARFRVTSGPLRDIEGVIERVGSQARIYAAVTVLGQSVTLEIDPALLERIV